MNHAEPAIQPSWLPNVTEIAEGKPLDLYETFEKFADRVKAIGVALTDISESTPFIRTLGDVLFGMGIEAAQFNELWLAGFHGKSAVTEGEQS